MKADSELQESMKPDKSTLEVNKGGVEIVSKPTIFPFSRQSYACTHMD